jgi:hypothetical protein
MKPMKFNFIEVDKRQPNLIVKLAPTSEDGSYGEVVIEFGGLLEPREVTGTRKDGNTFKTTRYEMLAKPMEGAFIDVINKEEVPKKDPKTGRVIGKDLIPKSYSAEELLQLMKERGNDYIVIRLSQGNYEFIRKNVNSGKINKGDIIKLEYNIGNNGSVVIKRLLKAEVENVEPENAETENVEELEEEQSEF